MSKANTPETPSFTCSICDKVNPKNTVNCIHCNSQPRMRTLPNLISKILPQYLDKKLANSKPILAFSANTKEREYLNKYFNKICVATLYGSYGENTVTGVDVCDLSRYENNSFSAIYSMGVYDFVIEQEKAIQEAYRTISPGGCLLTLILPGKLVDDDRHIIIKSKLTNAKHKMDYVPKDSEMVWVSVGKSYFIAMMNKSGFKGHAIDIHDEIDGSINTWFIGVKP